MFSNLLNYDYNTIVLYILIVASASILATLSQSKIHVYNRTGNVYRENKIGWFFLSFLVLAFFACTTGVGADRESYKYFFRISEFGNLYKYFEPGFRIFIGVVKLVTDNEQVFLILVSFLTVAFTYKGIWDCRNDISVGLAVFIYSSQFYFQGYNIMRMYFAMSILMVGVKWIKEEKYFKYLIVIGIAACFHYGILFVGAAYVLALWFMKTKKVKFDAKFFIILLLAVLFSIFAIRIAFIVVENVPVLKEKYSHYLENITVSGVGFKVFYNLIPYAIGMIYAKYSTRKNEMLSIFGAYLIVTFIISVLSYSITMLGRALICLHMPSIILLPRCIESFRRNKRLHGDSRVKISLGTSRISVSYWLVDIFLCFYFIIGLILYLSGYLGLDGIDNFRFFWN